MTLDEQIKMLMSHETFLTLAYTNYSIIILFDIDDFIKHIKDYLKFKIIVIMIYMNLAAQMRGR